MTQNMPADVEAAASGEAAPPNPLMGTDVPERVYACLAAKFGYESWIQLTDVGMSVIELGINRKEYGFVKLGEFVEALVEALDGAMEERLVRIDERHSNREAIVHRAERLDAAVEEYRKTLRDEETLAAQEQRDAPVGTAPALNYRGAAQAARNMPDYISDRLEPSALAALSPKFSEVAFFPATTRGYLTPLAPRGADLIALASEAWGAALAEGAVRTYEGKLIFPLPLKRADGRTPVELVLAKNERTGDVTPWYVQFVDATVRAGVPRGQSPSRALTDFAYLGHWETFLGELAELALPESWEFADDPITDAQGRRRYPILMSYITNTFYRLQREDKICISDDESFAAFNSGLVNRRYDDIYVCFEPNVATGRNPWRFVGFCTKGVGRLGKRLVNLFNPLPPTATFFERKEDLLFDTERELIVNYDHVILDNMGRLPVEFLKEGLRTDDHALALLDELPAASTPRREEIIDEVRDILEQDNVAFMYLRVRLNDAIDRARKRVRWNYKTAIPMYYPRANSMSLLLPICLMDPSAADAALVVELMDSGNYQGQTILTMRMAYQDARLVCRPDSDWLTTNARSTDED